MRMGVDLGGTKIELAVFDDSVERLVGWARGAGDSAGSGQIRRLA